MVAISLPDGSVRNFDGPVTGAALAADIGPGLAKAALVVKVDGELRDLAVARREAECVGQAAADDLVGYAHVDHVRRVCLGRFLRGGQRDGRGIARHDAVHASRDTVTD